MTTIQLTNTQAQVLQHALKHNHGQIIWFPESVKGGARHKVLQGLFHRALITPDGSNWLVAAEGYDALGCARPNVESVVEPTVAPDQQPQATAGESEATQGQTQDVSCQQRTARTREHSKQATLIQMLQRSEGATLNQMVIATAWLPHTVRGAMTGALKKKLGLEITSTKVEGVGRVYRINRSPAA